MASAKTGSLGSRIAGTRVAAPAARLAAQPGEMGVRPGDRLARAAAAMRAVPAANEV